MEESKKQVLVGYYMSPDGQVIPLMADAKYYPNGVPESPLLTQQWENPLPPVQRNADPIRPNAVPVQRNTEPIQSNVLPKRQDSAPTASVTGSMQQGYFISQEISSMPSNEKKKEKSLENIVGRNLMGILASILIFIGMILFATVAYESFNSMARLCSIYAVSAVLLVIGLVGMHKNRNAFYLSLAGCGAGAVYISLFLTYGYFELINGFALYILLALWSVVVFFLGGKGSLLFKTIGQSGVLISVFYGTIMQFMEMKSPALLSFTLVLMIYYIAVTVFYLLMDHTKGYRANLPSFIMDYIGAVILVAAVVHIRSEIQLTVQIVLTGMILAYTLFLLFLYRRRIMKEEMTADDSLGWDIVVFVQSVFAALAVIVMIPNGEQNYKWIRGCIAMVQFGILWLLTEYKVRRDAGRAVALGIIYIFFWIFSNSFGVMSEILGIGMFALIFLTTGFFRKDKLYFSFGCASSFIYILFYGKYPAVYALFSILFILLILFFLLYSDRIYHASFKLLAYAMLQVFLFKMDNILPQYTVFPRAVWINTVYLVSVILCIAATHSHFCNDWLEHDKKEKSTQLALGVINIILMFWGTWVLDLMNGEVFHVLTLLALLAACCQNIMPMVRHYGKSMGVGFYTGFKLTVFLQSALYSYQIESYVVTLACLFMALVLITFGFIRNYKPIRLYGLILSLYSIFKLVMIDVSYHSTLSRALTVMGCGVLAFIISFVYNKISKRLGEAETEEKYK